MRFDADSFIERAAIMEFDAGMSRFKAETEAARLQSAERWQALQFLKEATDANGRGNSQRGANTDTALARRRSADDMP